MGAKLTEIIVEIAAAPGNLQQATDLLTGIHQRHKIGKHRLFTHPGKFTLPFTPIGNPYRLLTAH